MAGGPYVISATLSPAAALDNYNVTYETASFTIAKANASVTANAASKTYGAADPALTGTLAGFLVADGVTASYSRTAGETVAGGPYTISATLSPAAALDNYTVTYNSATFTIAKANASVTPNAASKIYGAADPTLTGTPWVPRRGRRHCELQPHCGRVRRRRSVHDRRDVEPGCRARQLQRHLQQRQLHDRQG